MNKPLLHSLGYTLAVALFASLWLVAMTATGWYRDVGKMELALAVPIVEIVLLILANRQLRNDGATIGARVGLCVMLVLVAAILVAAFAFVYTANQDNYFTHLQQVHADGLRRAGRSDAEIATALANHSIGTPRGFALNRFRNTVVFGVIGTLAGLLLFRGRRA